MVIFLGIWGALVVVGASTVVVGVMWMFLLVFFSSSSSEPFYLIWSCLRNFFVEIFDEIEMADIGCTISYGSICGEEFRTVSIEIFVMRMVSISKLSSVIGCGIGSVRKGSCELEASKVFGLKIDTAHIKGKIVKR